MLNPSTLGALFETQARGNARPALRTKRNGAWATKTWNEWRTESRAVASALIAAGIAPGDRVAIFGSTREEWVIADVANFYAGAITVPIYPSLIGEQAAYIADDAEVKALFADDASFVARIADASPSTLAHVSCVVLFDGDASSLAPEIAKKCQKWADLMQRAVNRADDAEIERRLENTKPQDLATIVYTSGTTGPPKGAMLTHDNFIFETSTAAASLGVTHEDEHLLFLPLAHIFARILVAVQMRVGFATSFAESMTKAMDNVVEVNPTFIGCVPRLYEKIHAVANERANATGGSKKKIYDWAVAVGGRVARARVAREPIGSLLAFQYAIAKRLVLSQIRARFGTRMRFVISGGAPLAEALCVWFYGAGVDIYEGYGLTETTAASHLGRGGAVRFGTVGRTLPGVEAKIAADGEVLMRGRNIMAGYFKKSEATAEVIDADGFFHSGDIGTIDADGYLRITDRKKDLIVTAGGKNVAPQNIENLLKQSGWVSQATVLGDNKPYLVALITLDAEAAARFAKERGKQADLRSLAHDPELRALVAADVDAVNAHLSSFETVKKFAILPSDFSIESGELTPTLKVKRKVVMQRHQQTIDALYVDARRP